MIQIEDIQIENFRGIRNLRLDLRSESFVVVGPNGTGKSGIVDALEFVLTGNVSRLGGRGSGELGLITHAPHVLCKENPENARVSATVRATSSDEVATLSRSVHRPSRFVLEPESDAVRAAIERIENHPEIVLSRREIIKFILTPPSQRAEDVQTLLRLEGLGKMRVSLRSAKGKLNSAVSVSRRKRDDAAADIARHFDLEEPSNDDLLKSLNERRVTLGIDSLVSLDVEDVSAGMTDERGDGAVNKATAGRDIRALLDSIGNDAPARDLADTLASTTAPVVEDPSLVQELDRKGLVDTGLDLLGDERCPLCDHTWPSVDALRSHLEAKVERLKQAGELSTRIEDASRALSTEVGAVVDAIGLVSRIANDLEQTTVVEGLTEWQESLRLTVADLTTVGGALSLGEQVIDDPLQVPAAAPGLIETVRSSVASLPDVSTKAEATSFLTLAQERLDKLKAGHSEFAAAVAAENAAAAAYDAYCEAQDGVLGRLYESVAATFAEYYGSMNSDEGTFTARLEPNEQQLNLLVDFYALGMFPPAAYHSEGHQDGMGVSLYLALMKHQLGDDFRLAVLDDVVMSIDADHRKHFCELLKNEFPDVQFIITTHDRVWARQMVTSQLIGSKRQLRIDRWDVENGPWVSAGTDFWDDIEIALNNNKVRDAASQLRHSLEWILSDLADHYRCPIPYSATGTYDLGDYLSAIKGRFRGLLSKAAEAANSWNDSEAMANVKSMKEAWTRLSLAQESEHWVVNRAIHYNEWANLSKPDFEPVVTAWREFLSFFECSECGSVFYVTKHDGKDDALRCDCRNTNMNLRKKP